LSVGVTQKGNVNLDRETIWFWGPAASNEDQQRKGFYRGWLGVRDEPRKSSNRNAGEISRGGLEEKREGGAKVSLVRRGITCEKQTDQAVEGEIIGKINRKEGRSANGRREPLWERKRKEGGQKKQRDEVMRHEKILDRGQRFQITGGGGAEPFVLLRERRNRPCCGLRQL